MAIQRKTQRPEYWQEHFTVEYEDLEHLYNLFIESGRPHSVDELALALVRRRCEKEEEIIRAELEKGQLFQPKNSYGEGQKIVLPAFDYVLGTVVGVRPGYNPEYGEFKVIQVQIEGDDGKVREFASELKVPHKLNREETEGWDLAGELDSPEELYFKYGRSIRDQLERRLRQTEELGFVNFGTGWFLKDLIAEVHIGHLNIAEAMLEVSGRPLSSEEILKELDLPPEVDRKVQVFSLNYSLRQDERFNEVGTDEKVLWFLRRLEPPEALNPPRHLLASVEPYDRSLLNEELLRLEKELDDEATEAAIFAPSEMGLASSVTFVLTYPHYRSGTIPLTPRTRAFFPKGSTQHTMITFIDGRSGRHMPGWVVHQHKYACGLAQWYRENDILVGAYITLERTEDPMTVIINYTPRRQKREWVRIAKAKGTHLSFEMKTIPCGCEYDELMAVGVEDPASLDELRKELEEKKVPLSSLLSQIFPELAKLSPQGTVHAKTLYSAINVCRRYPPGPVFAALAENPSFKAVGDGYWLYDKSI